jgi:hypothetical protein
MAPILLYSASVIIFIWGISHIIPTRAIVHGFGKLSADNQNILIMEWVAEGVTLVFIGLLVGTVEWQFGVNAVSIFVFRFCAGMLMVMALWTLLTGARTSNPSFKICPIVKTVCAAMICWATMC